MLDGHVWTKVLLLVHEIEIIRPRAGANTSALADVIQVSAPPVARHVHVDAPAAHRAPTRRAHQGSGFGFRISDLGLRL